MKTPYQNLTWHSREVILHSYPLTDEDRLKLGQEMADARALIVRREAEFSSVKQAFKDEIAGYASQLGKAAAIYKSGFGEAVEVECDIYQDFENSEIVYVDAGLQEELKRRPMTEKEKYPSLFSLDENTRAEIFPFKKE